MVGSTTLPAEVQDSVTSIQSSVTCSTRTTIDKVPDVTSGNVSFSSIDFSKSSSTALQFALDTFTTATPLASTDLKAVQDQLNVYLATEAGLRSVDGSLAIKVPKFFLGKAQPGPAHVPMRQTLGIMKTNVHGSHASQQDPDGTG